MLSKSKSILFSAFEKTYKLFVKADIKKIPGVQNAYGFLFQILWSNKSIVEIQGSKMYVNPNKLPKSFRKTFRMYIMPGVWEELTTEMFKKVIKEGDTVVDVGANIGYFTLLATRLVSRSGKVYAFEPEPRNYNLLLKNIEVNRYDNIVTVQKAVSNVTETVRLFLDDKDTGAHTIYQPDTERKFIDVQSVTLDEFFKDKKHPIDVIKMDIEGAEMAALLGMKRIIRENKNLKMFVEFHFPSIRRRCDSPEEFVRRLLDDYHFSILAIGDYLKDRKCMKINNVDELMNFCKGEKTMNLFLERR